MDHNDVVCLEAYCITLMDILTHASSQAIPRPRSKPQSQVWDGNVSRSMATNKQSLAEWNEANRPPHGPLWEPRKNTKKLLRQALRTSKCYQQSQDFRGHCKCIPTRHQVFHRLIRKQRSTASSPGTEMVIDSRLISSIDEVP